MKKILSLFFLLLILIGISKSQQPSPTVLAQLINNYRVQNGLPSIQISPSLMTVALYHANVMVTSPKFPTGCDSSYSWPAPPSSTNLWKQCCYNTSSHTCMTGKPSEITSGWSNPYTGNGYEIVGTLTGTDSQSENAILSNFLSSSSITDFFLEKNTWSSFNWNALGIGIVTITESNSLKTLVYVWLGPNVDKNFPPPTPLPSLPPSSGGSIYDVIQLVNQFRLNNSKPTIPISYALTYTSQEHVDAIIANPSTIAGQCNELSWPEPPLDTPNLWTSCCYPSDSSCMTRKVAELTDSWTIPYTSDSYEVSGSWTGVSANLGSIMNLFFEDGSFSDLFLERSSWSSHTWRSIGAGVAKSTESPYILRVYIHFGEAVDGNIPPTPTTPSPSSSPDLLPPIIPTTLPNVSNPGGSTKDVPSTISSYYSSSFTLVWLWVLLGIIGVVMIVIVVMIFIYQKHKQSDVKYYEFGDLQ